MMNDKLANAPLDAVDRSTNDRSWEYSPRIDLLETTEEFRVEVELPGIRPEDIDVDLENGILRIRGRAVPRDESGLRVRVREFGAFDFARTVRLGDSIDTGRISAETKDGLLTLRLPKRGALIPQKIRVNSAN
jgi:HSP20 family protein